MLSLFVCTRPDLPLLVSGVCGQVSSWIWSSSSGGDSRYEPKVDALVQSWLRWSITAKNERKKFSVNPQLITFLSAVVSQTISQQQHTLTLTLFYLPKFSSYQFKSFSICNPFCCLSNISTILLLFSFLSIHQHSTFNLMCVYYPQPPQHRQFTMLKNCCWTPDPHFDVSQVLIHYSRLCKCFLYICYYKASELPFLQFYCDSFFFIL